MPHTEMSIGWPYYFYGMKAFISFIFRKHCLHIASHCDKTVKSAPAEGIACFMGAYL